MTAEPGSPEVQTRVVRAAGTDISVAVRGTGQPLLLIMGLGGNIRMWEPLQRWLVPHGFQTISFDAPGTGDSPRLRRPRRMTALATMVQQILEAIGQDQVDVLGVSLGGAIAQQLAHQAPSRVRKLILAATMPGLGGVPGSPAVLLRMTTRRRYRDPEYFNQVAGRLYGGRAAQQGAPTPEYPPPAAMSPPRSASPPGLAGYLHQLYAIQGWTSMPWLHQLPHDTLVMAGDDDPIVPLVNARLLTWRIPKAELHIVRGGGHLFLIEEPGPCAAVIAEFLHRR